METHASQRGHLKKKNYSVTCMHKFCPLALAISASTVQSKVPGVCREKDCLQNE